MNPYYWKADYCNSSKWQANGIVTLQTGVPFNVSTATGTANTAASGTYTPNLVHAATSECGRGHLVGCIDAIAFTVANLYPIAPTNFDYGNAGRNLLRFETFALLNHTNFANPSATINTSSFGNITGASGNRNIQIGAKLQF